MAMHAMGLDGQIRHVIAAMRPEEGLYFRCAD
jgi:hypothetical protein